MFYEEVWENYPCYSSILSGCSTVQFKMIGVPYDDVIGDTAVINPNDLFRR